MFKVRVDYEGDIYKLIFFPEDELDKLIHPHYQNATVKHYESDAVDGALIDLKTMIKFAGNIAFIIPVTSPEVTRERSELWYSGYMEMSYRYLYDALKDGYREATNEEVYVWMCVNTLVKQKEMTVLDSIALMQSIIRKMKIDELEKIM